MTSSPDTVDQLHTPALLVDRAAFDANLAAMDAVLPGRKLRPHVKAFKSTALASRLAADGHVAFCAATTREVEGLILAGLTDDILLANETVDTARLASLAQHSDNAQITVAVDSAETVAAAATAGIRSVLIDVEVGLPRCGCAVDQAGPLADAARAAGMTVRGVMGYEGHLMMVEDRIERTDRVHESMAQLLEAADAVGGTI
ncbi:MAG: metal-activated pyridoxal enzyme, partial [Acidimicrobiales bacterium]|nr:metal-activated pyridoxal enzyme [Acidimicrobiales bacterium]